MLIFSQDRTMLLNMDSGVYAIEAKERRVVAIGGRRQAGAVVMEVAETVLGEYSNSDEAEKVLEELAGEYGKYYRVEGGPMATVNAFVQPLMFEPPKVYKMPAYR